MRPQLRSTYTYAILEVPREVYDDIRARLVEVGHDQAVHVDSDGEVLDMHGIALRASEGAAPSGSGSRRRQP